jgi:diaminopimelate epimerase
MRGEPLAWLMSGAGNELLVLDGRGGLPLPPSELARRLCAPSALGVDGLMAVLEAEEERVRVAFANADGSGAGFCGNGARCLTRFCAETGLTGDRPLLLFPEAEVRGRYLGRGRAEVLLDEPRLAGELSGLAGAGPALAARLVTAGVPHVVLVEESPGDLDLLELAPALRRAPEAGPGGANVTVCSAPRAGEAGRVRTFERGVEGVTGACGSGALAAAAVLWERGLPPEELSLLPPSGRVLTVRPEPPGAVVLGGEVLCRLRGSLPAESWKRADP